MDHFDSGGRGRDRCGAGEKTDEKIAERIKKSLWLPKAEGILFVTKDGTWYNNTV